MVAVHYTEAMKQNAETVVKRFIQDHFSLNKIITLRRIKEASSSI